MRMIHDPSKIQLKASSWIEVTSQDGEQGSDPPKPRYKALYQRFTALRWLYQYSSVANDPFKVPGSTLSLYAFHPYGTLLVVTV
jgi:hypothetical protein